MKSVQVNTTRPNKEERPLPSGPRTRVKNHAQGETGQFRRFPTEESVHPGEQVGPKRCPPEPHVSTPADMAVHGKDGHWLQAALGS